MGLQVDRSDFAEDDFRRFRHRLDLSLKALRARLEGGFLDHDECSLGAELELVIADAGGRPLPLNRVLSEQTRDPRWQLEIDRFNLEYNLTPVAARGTPFSVLRAELDRVVAQARALAAPHGALLHMVGILPTLRASDLSSGAMTDLPRYRALSEGIRRLRRKPFQIDIAGDDRLELLADDVTFEGANNSFQLHMRTRASRFAVLYNALQLATAPALALSTNSPLLFGKRLWEETRIALFKQSVDTRVVDETRPRNPPRVSFGTGWVRHSASEIFAECVALYPPLIPLLSEQDPVECVAQGCAPDLVELRLHTGTVWRWNRPVYDPADGGHLRIEARTLPAGPTSIDMLASAAYLLGLAQGLTSQLWRLIEAMPFGYAGWNFYRAAQYGLDAQLVWPGADGGMRETSARSLAAELLPLAHRGLLEMGVSEGESAALLDIVGGRLDRGMTGARWQRERFRALSAAMPLDAALTQLVTEYEQLSRKGDPVHTWSP